MMIPKRKLSFPKLMSSSLKDLATPSNLNSWWNYGSLLGMFLIIQLISGLFLTCYYNPSMAGAFFSIEYIMRDVHLGWLFRIIHLNGASFFFLFLFHHVGRSIYQNSFLFLNTWNVGVIIFILSMLLGFLGYVLPWGQMSFWGATVITNFLSSLPIVGESLLHFLWGNFSISNPTLNRFFMLHFYIPFIILSLVVVHVYFLHEHGSSNPSHLSENAMYVNFFPFYVMKDVNYYFFFLFLFFFLVLYFPFLLGDLENSIFANSLVTPTHIVPEWYFLFCYAILRTISNKTIGVTMMIFSLAILFLPVMFSFTFKGSSHSIIAQSLFWCFVAVFLLLTFLGGKVVEYPFTTMSYWMLIMYFLLFLLFLMKSSDMMMKKW